MMRPQIVHHLEFGHIRSEIHDTSASKSDAEPKAEPRAPYIKKTSHLIVTVA